LAGQLSPIRGAVRIRPDDGTVTTVIG